MNKFDPFDENQTTEEQNKEPMHQNNETMHQSSGLTPPKNESDKKSKETTFLDQTKSTTPQPPPKKAKPKRTYDPTSRLVSFLLVLLVIVASFTGGYLYSEFSLEEDARVSRWLVNVLNENAYFADYGIDSTVLLRYGLKFALRDDPYAVLMTPEETSQYLMQSEGRSTSIGMSVAELVDTKGVCVIGVVGGSEAHSKGVKEGYKLLSVDGVDVWESTVAEIGEILNSKADNTDITIVFGIPTDSNGEMTYSKDNTETIILQRTQFTPVIVNYFDSDSPLYSEFLDGDTAYIQVESFVGKTKEQFDSVMKTFKEKGKKNLILDLRDNTGGSDINLMGVGSHLVGGSGEQNPLIITEKFRNKEDREIKAYNNYYADYNFDQIIVLTNENSASASEALLTSMIDYGTVDLIIGTTTYGKGTGLQTHFMPYLGYGVTFTASYFFSPKGNSHESVGLSPTKGYEMIDSRSFPYQLSTDAIFMRAINYLK